MAPSASYRRAVAKRNRDDATLAALSAARHAGPTTAAAVVRKGLKSDSPAVVARAAEVAADLAAEDVADDARAAAERWLDEGEAALLVALLRASRRCGAIDRDLYRRALRVERTEFDPVARRAFDVGATVRAEACRAVVETGDPGAAVLLAGLLFEASDHPAARAAAAQGLGVAGDDAAAEVLRLKLTRAGEDDPDVLGECVGSLCRLDPPGTADFLTGYLRGRPDVAEAAAVPLGEVRAARAVGPLLACHDVLRQADREELAFTALALVRQPAATARLLGRLRDARPPVAHEAATALHLLRHDPDIAAAVERVAKARPDGAALRRAFERGAGPQVERFG